MVCRRQQIQVQMRVMTAMAVHPLVFGPYMQCRAQEVRSGA